MREYLPSSRGALMTVSPKPQASKYLGRNNRPPRPLARYLMYLIYIHTLCNLTSWTPDASCQASPNL